MGFRIDSLRRCLGFGRKEYQPGDKSCIGYGERIEEKIFVAIECWAFPQSVVLNVFPILKKYVGGNFFPLQCNCEICILRICLSVTKPVSVVYMIFFSQYATVLDCGAGGRLANFSSSCFFFKLK